MSIFRKGTRMKGFNEIKKLKKGIAVGTAAAFIAALLTGCGSAESRGAGGSALGAVGGQESGNVSGAQGTADDSSEAQASAADGSGKAELLSLEEMFTDRDLSGEYDESEAEKISLSEGDITITREGVYILSGSLKDGTVIVDVPDTGKIQIVLDGVNIDNSSDAAIYIKQADKVFLTLAEGADNILACSSYDNAEEGNVDGVIFSKSDLTVNGSGSLTINAATGHGIVSKDDLKLTGGEITVTAQGQGLSGKDSVRIKDAALNIISGKDGIQSDNEEDGEKGFVYLSGGVLTINAQGDGISAGGVFQADGGVVSITAAGGSSNRTVLTDDSGDTVSTKGIKAGAGLVVNQGTFTVNSQDDALHSNASVTINGGVLNLASGDDGIHADETAAVTGGSIQISEAYEGIEGSRVEISGGDITLYASDDGLNAAGGNDQSGFGGMFGGNRGSGKEAFGGNGDSMILISGGVMRICADGDGIDSNGSLIVTGGETYVSGPEDGANGALDYDGEGQITGGILVAVGNSAMAMNFGDASTQGSIMLTFSSHAKGAVVTLKDSDGKALISYTAECDFNSVVVSCPGLELGGTYTVTAGEESTEVTLSDSLIYGRGFGMGGFGGGDGRRGGMGDRTPGGLPDGMERPEGMELPDGIEPPEGGFSGGGIPEGMPEGGSFGGGIPEGMPEGGSSGGRMPGRQGGN